MKDWRKTLISPETPILEAMRIIDASALQITLVIDEGERLIGVVTDGDIRRALLKGLSMDTPVRLVMNTSFTTASADRPREEILALMKKKELRHIPIIDLDQRVVDLKLLNDLITLPQQPYPVFLMAGGLGTRLQPLTNDCPKPLLKIGDKPILEIILENFIDFGFRKFFMSVNYKAEMIEDHFGDGSRWGVQIQYIHEDRKMGTAGSLSLLPERPEHAIIVMNGDVLSKVNLQHLIDFHAAHKAKATVCVKDYHFQFPYGVIKADQHRLKGIDEKPIQRFFVNAGIYVLEPEVLEWIPRDARFDMTDLFRKLLLQKLETIVFPIHENWMDIGRIEDLAKASEDYSGWFK
jgi:dTDP-glucose pyrophosphorylase/predicted transcriptional regulator